MNKQYEAAHFNPVIINGIEFTQADFVCLARKAQEYVRITGFEEPVNDVFHAGCYSCPYGGGNDSCANIIAMEKLTKLTGTYFSLWEGKDGGMSGLPDEYKKPKDE